MVQLELFTEDKKSEKKYTIGVINDYESQWFVRNNHPEKNKTIMEYLLMYPNTRPLQSNHKHYIYELRDKNKK
tara:strand:+ start:1250 stop:1468 length:219 start_codon:yes stop_codon:yes gene_type:complete